MRKALIVACFFGLAMGPASAQLRSVQVPRPPVEVQPIQVQPPAGAANFDPAMTPETARAAINRLKARNRELRQQMTVTLEDLQRVRTQLDEMTRLGGTMVRAQCVSATLSRRTDGGAEENCAASGYLCGGVEGTCYRQCTSSSQCYGTGGFRCNPISNRCELQPPDDGE